MSTTRLLACMVLANVWHAGATVTSNCGTVATAAEAPARLVADVLQLLDEPGPVGKEAPALLAAWASRSEAMQAAALAAGAVPELAACLCSLPPAAPARQRENILAALAALCATKEHARRQLLDFKMVEGGNRLQPPSASAKAAAVARHGGAGPRASDFLAGPGSPALAPVLAGLEHGAPGVRAAACSCLQSLSRSLRNLHQALSSGHIFAALVKLLNDHSHAVQASALAALCNIVLDFSPTKAALLHGGALPQICALARSKGGDRALQLSALLCLQNALYLAGPPAKAAILAELGFSALLALLQELDPEVQERAISIVRNVTHGAFEDADQIVRHADGGAVLDALARHLSSNSRPQLTLQALSALCNVAAGSCDQKDSVLPLVLQGLPDKLPPSSRGAPGSGGGTPAPLAQLLCHPTCPGLRATAVLCALNLSHPKCCGAQRRVELMRGAGVDAHLRVLLEDPCCDVQYQARAALRQFDCVDVLPLDEAMPTVHSTAALAAPATHLGGCLACGRSLCHCSPLVDRAINKR
eukprot:SM000093S24439  [mRNA]  locus=s93:345893:348673:- [translate_table: standard]